jgi:site-specific DNA-cytosine methylase
MSHHHCSLKIATIVRSVTLITAVHAPRLSPDSSSPHHTSLVGLKDRNRAHLFGSLFWAVMTGWCVRLTVVALVYKGFLDPARDHWEFAYEMGRVARSIALKRGFANPYWAACKGFSGLLSERKSSSEKYQALNRLTLRGMFLMLEAFIDDLPEFILLENVPRIQTRGRFLLDQITALLRNYGYLVVETTHDCGELGGLAQSRKRFLMVARLASKVPSFLYEPPKRPLRAVGDILERLPLPGDARGGPMHLLPNLQWKTWVRLAFVEAGSDWRSLNKLRVKDGRLADYVLTPDWFGDVLGVTPWNSHVGTITGGAASTRGAFSVADPRFSGRDNHQYGVVPWTDAVGSIINVKSPGQGAYAVSDPRIEGTRHNNVFRLSNWDDIALAVTAGGHPTSGGIGVADPRARSEWHHNVYRVTPWEEARGTITGGESPSNGSGAVADPRPIADAGFSKYAVTPWKEAAGTVIGGDDQGAYAVADPRAGTSFHGKGKYRVNSFDEPTNTVIAESSTGHGSFAVADPRLGLNRDKGDHYLTAGHFGVIPWTESCGAVSAAGSHDNGRFNVADPRVLESPAPEQKMIARIRALDGTWHRPFTTLELASLQSLIDPDDLQDLDGDADGAKRERIGNAVPPDAAKAIADVMAEALLLTWSGQSFQLSSTPIWVRDVAVALSVRLPR